MEKKIIVALTLLSLFIVAGLGFVAQESLPKETVSIEKVSPTAQSIRIIDYSDGSYEINTMEVYQMEEKQYQGPVRPTDNLEHFRKTGETIKEEAE